MRIAVVGNGPSALQYGAELDACDRVVRCNGWEPDARVGRKWTDWFAFLESLELQARVAQAKLLPRAPAGLTVWVREFARYDRGIGAVHQKGRHLVFHYDGQEPRAFPLRTYHGGWLRTWYVREDKRQPAGPTTGIYAIAEMLALEPEELVIAGFDATAPADKETWGEWWTGRFASTVQQDHDMPFEKKLLDRWLTTREFCGRPYPKTRPTWLRFQGAA